MATDYSTGMVPVSLPIKLLNTCSMLEPAYLDFPIKLSAVIIVMDYVEKTISSIRIAIRSWMAYEAFQ